MAIVPILRTEVYEGALDGDDRNPSDPDNVDVWLEGITKHYPNANGSQSGPIYLPGPAALSDDNPATRIRMSSAWAADWFIVFDASSLTGADITSLTVNIDVATTYVDPTDSDQFFELDVQLVDWVSQDHYYYTAAAQQIFTVEVGEPLSIEWVIDEAWLAGSHDGDGETTGYHWYDPHAGHTVPDFLAAALSGDASEICIYLQKGSGGHPWEVDIRSLSLTIDGDITTTIDSKALKVVRRFT